jgi:hypothetical protein
MPVRLSVQQTLAYSIRRLVSHGERQGKDDLLSLIMKYIHFSFTYSTCTTQYGGDGMPNQNDLRTPMYNCVASRCLSLDEGFDLAHRAW